MGERRSIDANDPMRKRLGAGTSNAGAAFRRFEKVRGTLDTPPPNPLAGKFSAFEDFKRRMAQPRPDPLGNAAANRRKILSSALGGGKAIR